MYYFNKFPKQSIILSVYLINQEYYVGLAQLTHFLDGVQGGLEEDLGDIHFMISHSVVKLPPDG